MPIAGNTPSVPNMVFSRADIQKKKQQADLAAAQVDAQTDAVIRLKRTKQASATAEAALEMMVKMRDKVLGRLKTMRKGQAGGPSS